MPPNSGAAFCLVLHAHLPYVLAHGRWPHGTDWLNEAAAETYLPLLDVLYELVDEGIKPNITINISPVLCEQLADARFAEEFIYYLTHKKESAERDCAEYQKEGNSQLASVALFWVNFFKRCLHQFEHVYHKNFVAAFKKLQDAGAIEIITCAATHGYLPLLSRDESVELQIKEGVRTYKKHFGRKPKGMWLPECAYRPAYEWESPVAEAPLKYVRRGMEDFLRDAGIRYFFADSHMVKRGEARGVYVQRFPELRKLWGIMQENMTEHPAPLRELTPYYPYALSSSQGEVCVFVRDEKTGQQVWNASYGYPGEAAYLDFHKKKWPGGHRYWRVTGENVDMAEKDAYHPDWIAEKISAHAAHFVSVMEDIAKEQNKPCLICAPYDAELFGHWWFEGPLWLKEVLKKLSGHPFISSATCSSALEIVPPEIEISLPEGSWGEGGFHFVWLNKNTRWTWKELYEVENETWDFLGNSGTGSNLRENSRLREICELLLKELLLLQSSDWQFLISTWSARDYAEKRFNLHLDDVKFLLSCAKQLSSGASLGANQLSRIVDLRNRDAVFEGIK